MTLVLAIDIGGTKVEAAVVDADGSVRQSTRTRRPTGRSVDPAALRIALREVIEHATADCADEIVAVGVGAAGPFDQGGSVIAPVNMPGLHGFPLAAETEVIVQAVIGRPLRVIAGHDGGCLALAESWLGAAAGAAASMSIVVSTGIGGGIVMDGVLLRGASGNAGHLGQTHVQEEELTLEEIASGPASVRWAQQQGWQGTDGEGLGAAAAAGDAIARRAIERSARAVGRALADAVTLLDLSVIAIGGGFSHVSPDYTDLVQGALRESIVLAPMRGARVVRSGLHGDGPLIGAAAIALQAAATPRAVASA